jgi:transcriptional regulator with XRE-family HTH domain
MYKPLSKSSLKDAMAKAREAAGYGQRQVEKKLGMRHLRLYDYESGRLKLPVDDAVSLANVYNCSLEVLLGLVPQNFAAESGQDKVLPLILSGMMDEDYFHQIQLIYEDPVIQAETGIYDYKSQPAPIRKITGALNDKHRRMVLIDMLKCVNSLIGIDDKVSQGEAVFREHLKRHQPEDLSNAERKSIVRALTEPYLSNSVGKTFTSKSLKHLLVWILLLCAYSDQTVDPKEIDYIRQIVKLLELPIQDLEYIHNKIKNAKNHPSGLIERGKNK